MKKSVIALAVIGMTLLGGCGEQANAALDVDSMGYSQYDRTNLPAESGTFNSSGSEYVERIKNGMSAYTAFSMEGTVTENDNLMCNAKMSYDAETKVADENFDYMPYINLQQSAGVDVTGECQLEHRITDSLEHVGVVCYDGGEWYRFDDEFGTDYYMMDVDTTWDIFAQKMESVGVMFNSGEWKRDKSTTTYTVRPLVENPNTVIVLAFEDTDDGNLIPVSMIADTYLELEVGDGDESENASNVVFHDVTTLKYSYDDVSVSMPAGWEGYTKVSDLSSGSGEEVGGTASGSGSGSGTGSGSGSEDALNEAVTPDEGGE